MKNEDNREVDRRAAAVTVFSFIEKRSSPYEKG
jgi:hypothetical protein